MLPVRVARRALDWPRLGFDDAIDLFGRFFDGGETTGMLPYQVDVREDENSIYVEADMPGLTKDDIDVTLEDGILTIAGEKKTHNEEDKGGYHVRERRYGKFSRSFRLPETASETIDASLKDGVLTIKLAKREEVKPRKIDVNVG
jgi:HSP20 family protein